MAATTLYEYYTSKGQKLPSISERAKIYEQAGLGPASTYRGTAEQNIKLLQALQSTPTLSSTTKSTTIQPTTIVEQQFAPIASESITRSITSGDIFSMISKIAEQQFAPIRSIMEQYIKGISQKYDDEYLKALQQRQQKEEEELIGEMSERGFDPSSGVTQAALNELRARHQQEIQNLLTEKERAITSAQTELAKLQQSGLTSLYGVVPELLSLQLQYQKAQQPQTITHETGIYSYDPTTNTVKQLMAFPTTDKVRDIIQDASGQYYIVRESGKIEALGITGAPSKTTTSPYTLTGLMSLQKVKEELGITPDWKITNINKAREKIAAMQIGLPAGRTLASAIREAILSYAFATSGKQMSWKEAEMRFKDLIPGVLDDEATIIYKIQSLENAFKLFGTLPHSPNISTEDQWEKIP